MKISVAGLGYVGVSNAVLLARNHLVYAYDPDCSRIEAIRRGISPIIDNEVGAYLQSDKLQLHVTSNPHEAYRDSDYVIIATPTNYDPKTNSFDTSLVEAAITDVLAASPSACIVIRSTVPVGYTLKVREQFGVDSIIFSPEFLREGHALYDCLYPSRIVIGDRSARARRFSDILRSAALRNDIEAIHTGSSEAEAIKLFSNTYLAMRIAYFNELDSYASMHELNPLEVISGVCLDPRIGSFYNNPSFGYGGYCLPKDTQQLLANYRDVPQNIIKAVVESNRTRKEFIAECILRKKPKTVGIYRLSMKLGSDNFRESSVIDVMEYIKKRGVEVILYEPNLVSEEFLGSLVISDIEYFKNRSCLIVANRISDDISDKKEKIYSRDIFGID
ncbi:nucleotide sugar dehydrogenase [Aureimonas sp. SK2]|uniref:nucleotide sugar dehydrogenase n=1 Tax=Aureimonas sp. SK2 TaxID=3015992 RepID=UPI002444C6B4|nr:nucleotide sugar dehydrogenase [Aureimonas sp. SK2]